MDVNVPKREIYITMVSPNFAFFTKKQEFALLSLFVAYNLPLPDFVVKCVVFLLQKIEYCLLDDDYTVCFSQCTLLFVGFCYMMIIQSELLSRAIEHWLPNNVRLIQGRSTNYGRGAC